MYKPTSVLAISLQLLHLNSISCFPVQLLHSLNVSVVILLFYFWLFLLQVSILCLRSRTRKYAYFGTVCIS